MTHSTSRNRFQPGASKLYAPSCRINDINSSLKATWIGTLKNGASFEAKFMNCILEQMHTNALHKTITRFPMKGLENQNRGVWRHVTRNSSLSLGCKCDHMKPQQPTHDSLITNKGTRWLCVFCGLQGVTVHEPSHPWNFYVQSFCLVHVAPSRFCL